MREIKYRIPWYSVSGVFQGFTYWGRIDSKELFSLDCFTSPGQWGSRRAKPDEQFTGLLDKNGNEIYEGDIVRAIDSNTHEYDDEIDDVVSFIGSCFSLSESWETLDYFGSNNLEVIGNIHENQELLK